MRLNGMEEYNSMAASMERGSRRVEFSRGLSLTMKIATVVVGDVGSSPAVLCLNMKAKRGVITRLSHTMQVINPAAATITAEIPMCLI